MISPPSCGNPALEPCSLVALREICRGVVLPTIFFFASLRPNIKEALGALLFLLPELSCLDGQTFPFD